MKREMLMSCWISYSHTEWYDARSKKSARTAVRNPIYFCNVKYFKEDKQLDCEKWALHTGRAAR